MAVPTMTATHQQAVATLLSPPRLAPYLKASDGNVRAALTLYQWNVEMSSAVYKMLHLVEVFLRNSIDARLRVWNATQVDPKTGRRHGPDWLLDPSRLIERIVRREEIDKAMRRAKLAVKDSGTRLRSVTHDDVLAQLMFGTWRFLLPGRDSGRQLLWRDAISQAFPGLRRPVQDLVRDVDRLHRLRNRVAHLEPLLVVGVVMLQLKAARRVLREIEPAAEMWLSRTSMSRAWLPSGPNQAQKCLTAPSVKTERAAAKLLTGRPAPAFVNEPRPLSAPVPPLRTTASAAPGPGPDRPPR